jgi:hypothetical protein
VPPGPAQQYGLKLNTAIAGAYQILARSIDGMILSGNLATPGASGLRRLWYNGTTLYIDTTTSWTPIAIGNATQIYGDSTLLPTGCFPHGTTAGAGPGNMVPIMMPLQYDRPLSISSVDLFFSTGQASAVGSSQAKRLTVHLGMYAEQFNTYSLIGTTSHSLAWTVTGATFAGTGIKKAIVPWTTSFPHGPLYRLAVMTSTGSSGNALAGTHSQLLASSPLAFTFFGNLTESTTSVSTNKLVAGYAVRSASTTAFVAGDDQSNWSHTGAIGFPLIVMRGRSVG